MKKRTLDQVIDRMNATISQILMTSRLNQRLQSLMADMLSFDDYTALAKQIDLPDACHIEGSYHTCSGPALPVHNPASGELLCTISMANDKDVDFAVSKAREVFDNGDWSKAHPATRKQVLIKLAKLMQRNHHELAVIESLDSGKPISDCAQIDIPESINTFYGTLRLLIRSMMMWPRQVRMRWR